MKGEEDDMVLALLMDSTGQLVLAGEKMWFLLSGMALPRRGRKGMTMAGWESTATWQQPSAAAEGVRQEPMSAESALAGVACGEGMVLRWCLG